MPEDIKKPKGSMFDAEWNGSHEWAHEDGFTGAESDTVIAFNDLWKCTAVTAAEKAESEKKGSD